MSQTVAVMCAWLISEQRLGLHRNQAFQFNDLLPEVFESLTRVINTFAKESGAAALEVLLVRETSIEFVRTMCEIKIKK
jgi:hypothetical protein